MCATKKGGEGKEAGQKESVDLNYTRNNVTCTRNVCSVALSSPFFFGTCREEWTKDT